MERAGWQALFLRGHTLGGKR